jgi:two-component system LytT family response regulator
MDQIRALIVDDEPLARKDLRTILAEFPQVDIVGEADSVLSAKELIKNNKPNLIFLDIQMPGESGFDLLEYINPKTDIIFVTAFDEYAIRAFEVNALDYLLKPVDGERIKEAINRYPQYEIPHQYSDEILAYDDNLFLKLNNNYNFLRINTIIAIQAADDYTEIFTTQGKKLLVYKKMIEWDKRLPEQYFCRIHRSTIINIDKINKIEPWYNQSYHVHIEGIETPFTMSRRYFKSIKKKLK